MENTGTFGGVDVASGDLLVMYTYAADANLDGQIDAGDYGRIDNFVQVDGASGYANGDFNYDGFIDAGDYGIIDNNIQAQGPPLDSSITAAAAAVEESTPSILPLADGGSFSAPIARRPLMHIVGRKRDLLVPETEEDDRLVKSLV